MKKRSPFLILFALLAAAAIVAGCGGGGDSTGSTGDSTEAQSGSTESDESSGSAPTKAAFIKEADEICSKADDELEEEANAYAEDHGIDLEKEPTEDQQEELVEEVALPNVARQGEEIAALTPPEGDEETIEDLTDTLADEVAEAEDAGGLPDDDTLEGATEKAQEYGLTACGS